MSESRELEEEEEEGENKGSFFSPILSGAGLAAAAGCAPIQRVLPPFW